MRESAYMDAIIRLVDDFVTALAVEVAHPMVGMAVGKEKGRLNGELAAHLEHALAHDVQPESSIDTLGRLTKELELFRRRALER